MGTTMLIEITDMKAVGLLHELEELRLIKVLKEDNKPPKPRLSAKYRGFLTSEQGKSLDEHITQMRSEWKSTS